MALFLTHLTWLDLIRLIRWPNLTLVAICLFSFHRILHQICPASIPCLTMDGIDLLLFILVAIILTANGYIINDLKDIPTDTINRPDRPLVVSGISTQAVWNLYLSSISLGLILAILVAWRTNQWIWLPLYPVVTASLYVYATRWKGAPLWGNLLVALMTALLPSTLLLPELPLLHQLPPVQIQTIQTVFGGFALLALTTSFYREWIKDMEDVQGDREAGWRTWVVIHGLDKARSLAVLWNIFSILPLLAGLLVFSRYSMVQFFLGIAALIQVRMLIYLFQPNYPAYLQAISQSAKWTLALGLLAVLSL